MTMMHPSNASRIVALVAAFFLTLVFPFASRAATSNAITKTASTVPANGDINPYGEAVVPSTVGSLVAGDILVSNFNNSHNLQGTGTTIVQIGPGGAMHLFARINPAGLPGPCPGGVGLTTALAVTRTGWVFVGSLPTTDGTAATARAGCILVLNSRGHVVETFSGAPINGPWDMTAADGGYYVDLFFTNVLNGTVAAGGNVVNRGTVVRMTLAIRSGQAPHPVAMAVIGSGFSERTDPAALVIGPTGVGLSPNFGLLYVNDSLNNRIAVIPNPLFRSSSAGKALTLTSGGALNDPLGLAVAPNGNVLTVNGNNGFLVATTPSGTQFAKHLIDSSGNPPGAGALFGLAIVPGVGVYFVDDATNTLDLFH